MRSTIHAPKVSTHSRPKAAELNKHRTAAVLPFQHTAARRRLLKTPDTRRPLPVSTHSRPKAAGFVYVVSKLCIPFQHTAARRRLQPERILPAVFYKRMVSTHSRPKAAENRFHTFYRHKCFNTQPPEGGWFKSASQKAVVKVSTHSRPKAAGEEYQWQGSGCVVSTHSRPKAAV